MRCGGHGDYTVIGEEVTCTVDSGVDIGSFRCVIWRTGGGDAWNLDKVCLEFR